MKEEKKRDMNKVLEFYKAEYDTIFTEKVIADVISCSVALLQRQRWAGDGIPFLKIGRHVRYKKKDVLEWMQKKYGLKSTSEYVVFDKKDYD